MAATTAVLTRSRRWRLAPPELLACAGGAATAFWPWTRLTPAHLAVVIACLLPLALRTLLNLEEGLAVPVPTPFHATLGQADHRTVLQHDRTALALLEAQPDGRGILRQTNAAFTDLADAVGGTAGGDPRHLFTPASAGHLDRAMHELLSGAHSRWDGRLVLSASAPSEPASGALGAAWRQGDVSVQAGLVRLSQPSAGEPVVISMSLVPIVSGRAAGRPHAGQETPAHS